MELDSKSRIPLEIYPLIIDHVDGKTDLLSILVSSKAIFADVERKLYNSISFTGDRQGMEEEEDERHILFLESVLDPNRSHLPGFVYSYYYASIFFLNPAVLRLIKRALVTFTNLKQLGLGLPGENIFAWVLDLEKPPFQLELLEWQCNSISHRGGIGVLRFLSSQNALKTLYMVHNNANLAQKSPLQNLHTVKDIIGTVPTILSILPRSAPIERIHWISDFRDDLDHLPLLTGPRVLSITSTPLVSRPPLSVIAERFGTVKVLGLDSLRREELSNLYQLPIHTLVLLEAFDHTNEIFHNMEFLQHIFICTNNKGGLRGQYQRWDRYADTATVVSGHEVETNWWRRL